MSIAIAAQLDCPAAQPDRLAVTPSSVRGEPLREAMRVEPMRAECEKGVELRRRHRRALVRLRVPGRPHGVAMRIIRELVVLGLVERLYWNYIWTSAGDVFNERLRASKQGVRGLMR